MQQIATAALLALVGLVAGVIGTAGGITSLVAYPALLIAGVPPLAANVTCSVALMGSGASSALRSGPELRGRAGTVRHWLPLIAIPSLGGAVLLIATPPGVFARVVPALVAAGSLVLLLQPRLQRHGRVPAAAARVAGVAVGVYNGYFGAGAGILTIALLQLAGEPVLRRANAVKNVVLVLSDIGPAILFAACGTVVWAAVWPLAVGTLAGGVIGPVVARRVPPAPLRVAIALCGFALAAVLLVEP